MLQELPARSHRKMGLAAVYMLCSCNQNRDCSMDVPAVLLPLAKAKFISRKCSWETGPVPSTSKAAFSQPEACRVALQHSPMFTTL